MSFLVVAQHPNWTGNESIEDTVPRMLVDKYKPLRTGTIQTAEEKMHRAPSQILPMFFPGGYQSIGVTPVYSS